MALPTQASHRHSTGTRIDHCALAITTSLGTQTFRAPRQFGATRRGFVELAEDGDRTACRSAQDRLSRRSSEGRRHGRVRTSRHAPPPYTDRTIWRPRADSAEFFVVTLLPAFVVDRLPVDLVASGQPSSRPRSRNFTSATTITFDRSNGTGTSSVRATKHFRTAAGTDANQADMARDQASKRGGRSRTSADRHNSSTSRRCRFVQGSTGCSRMDSRSRISSARSSSLTCPGCTTTSTTSTPPIGSSAPTNAGATRGAAARR